MSARFPVRFGFSGLGVSRLLFCIPQCFGLDTYIRDVRSLAEWARGLKHQYYFSKLGIVSIPTFL